MRRRAWLAAAALLGSGCGYVGDTLPPLLRIPQPVSDLSAAQRGAVIVVEFTVPTFTTEGALLREPPGLDLRAGLAPDPWDPQVWAARGTPLSSVTVENNRARCELPAAPWAGREIVFGVRAIGANGRDAGWSNFVTVEVVAPLAPPRELRAESIPEGVRLAWEAQAPLFRLFRRGPGENAFAPLAETTDSAWTDAAARAGAAYEYRVLAVQKTSTGEAQSEPSEAVRVVPVDRLPPAVPAGLTAVTSTTSIELAWQRNTEPDLAAYRVYRSTPDGEFQPLAETGQTPGYSDRAIEPRQRYRYAVQAIDAAGNESALSPPVEAIAP